MWPGLSWAFVLPFSSYSPSLAPAPVLGAVEFSCLLAEDWKPYQGQVEPGG